MNNNMKGFLMIIFAITLALLLSTGILYVAACQDSTLPALQRLFSIDSQAESISDTESTEYIDNIPTAESNSTSSDENSLNADDSQTDSASSAANINIATSGNAIATPGEHGNANHTNESPDNATEEPSTEYTFPQEYITVDDSYFEDAVFLGDSRMQGFIKYCGLSGLRAYAYVGLDVNKYFSQASFNIDGTKMTASSALELDRNFSKVYIMFGTNELGWVHAETFIEKYVKVIEHIRSCNPDAVIFVNSILPVSSFAYKSQSFLQNDRVWKYNELLEQMANELDVYYLDLANVVANEDGVLPDDAARDGVHINGNYVRMCLEYMKTHGINPPPADMDDSKEATYEK